jgi:hypothetical protein
MIAHVGAAVPGNPTAIDTHWIWQEGIERLTVDPPRIEDGHIAIPDKPGLGIEVDRDQIMKAHKVYEENCLGARDDAIGMQYLIPGGSSTPSVLHWYDDGEHAGRAQCSAYGGRLMDFSSLWNLQANCSLCLQSACCCERSVSSTRPPRRCSPTWSSMSPCRAAYSLLPDGYQAELLGSLSIIFLISIGVQ